MLYAIKSVDMLSNRPGEIVARDLTEDEAKDWIARARIERVKGTSIIFSMIPNDRKKPSK